MTKQLAFIIFCVIGFGLFTYTCLRLRGFFKLTRPGAPITNISERIKLTLLVAFGQTKILRRPVIGFLHALVWWGFIVITIGTAEMLVDGLIGKERFLGPLLGPVYDLIIASGDIFAAIIIVACVLFLARRHILHVKRFKGVEMKPSSSVDATIALLFILMLMVSLIGVNIGSTVHYKRIFSDASDIAMFSGFGSYPVSDLLVSSFGWDRWTDGQLHLFFEVNWWAHISLVVIFMNVLPYSKHFHVFMSVPNVFLSNLKPMTKIQNMEAVTKEVRNMLNPDTAFAEPPPGEEAVIPRFGVKDVEDVTWKNYADALTCTQCGRCTDVCPANTTGKLLSPRKILVDTRKRMNDKGPGLLKDGNYDDGKKLVGDYITQEELWACTTCNACVQECPVNIDHVSLIMDMRRSLVMEDSQAPDALATMFANIENNGAPWQFSQADRMNWAEGLTRKQ